MRLGSIKARPVLRRYSAALAVVLLSGYVSGVAHFARVTHGLCAAHGEAIHIKDPPAGHTHVAREGLGFTGDEPLTESHDHDHCVVALAANEHTLAAAPHGVPSMALAVLRELPPFADVGTSADRALYRLAPKLSPPTLLG